MPPSNENKLSHGSGERKRLLSVGVRCIAWLGLGSIFNGDCNAGPLLWKVWQLFARNVGRDFAQFVYENPNPIHKLHPQFTWAVCFALHFTPDGLLFAFAQSTGGQSSAGRRLSWRQHCGRSERPSKSQQRHVQHSNWCVFKPEPHNGQLQHRCRRRDAFKQQRRRFPTGLPKYGHRRGGVVEQHHRPVQYSQWSVRPF